MLVEIVEFGKAIEQAGTGGIGHCGDQYRDRTHHRELLTGRQFRIDELWQEEQWGADYFALQTRDAHRADMMAAVRFLELVGPGS